MPTLQEGRSALGKDFDFLLSFLHARWVAGERRVFYEWKRKLWREIVRSREQDLISQIHQKIKERHIGDMHTGEIPGGEQLAPGNTCRNSTRFFPLPW